MKEHFRKIKKLSLNDLFKTDPDRFKTFSYREGDFLVDFSKNHITQETIALLLEFAQSRNLPDALAKLNAGKVVNLSEKRAARQNELRKPKGQRLPEVQAALDHMNLLIQKIHQDKTITDILTIGIGGSHLGPKMAIEALSPYAVTQQKFHFVSTLDAHQITKVLNSLNPPNTIIIISSKSFTTQETVLNSKLAQKWLGQYAKNNIYGITANHKAAEDFGILKDHILPLWDWVGGRYSIWSTIGFPLALQIGLKNFEDFLAGGHAMDKHVASTPLEKNIPVMMGLINHWYINFFNAQSHAILAYDIRLSSLPSYLQQLEMESNGKSVTQKGKNVKVQTGPIIWGSAETDGQHAFHQLLHQGTQLCPIDFIATRKPHHSDIDQHRLLFANCLSQAYTLMTGEDVSLPYKKMPGNRPSTMILLPELNPFMLGFLIALYEYKVFVSATLWGINPFDQWGVELGKKCAADIDTVIKNPDAANPLDISTRGLIEWFSKEC
ncbi:MAG TPA: glucose-6-phosphate isomerase [Gammaproteobacteria bacterium]|nr:glucose-6-phosphate isomerase [Gammaproteobacteria bacterium]